MISQLYYYSLYRNLVCRLAMIVSVLIYWKNIGEPSRCNQSRHWKDRHIEMNKTGKIRVVNMHHL